MQSRLEDEGEALVAQLDALSPGADNMALNQAYAKHAANVHQSFLALPEKIIEKYADGWFQDLSPIFLGLAGEDHREVCRWLVSGPVTNWLPRLVAPRCRISEGAATTPEATRPWYACIRSL